MGRDESSGTARWDREGEIKEKLTDLNHNGAPTCSTGPAGAALRRRQLPTESLVPRRRSSLS